MSSLAKQCGERAENKLKRSLRSNGKWSAFAWIEQRRFLQLVSYLSTPFHWPMSHLEKPSKERSRSVDEDRCSKTVTADLPNSSPREWETSVGVAHGGVPGGVPMLAIMIMRACLYFPRRRSSRSTPAQYRQRRASIGMRCGDWRKFFIAKCHAGPKARPNSKYQCPDVPGVMMVHSPMMQDWGHRFPLACRWDTAA